MRCPDHEVPFPENGTDAEKQHCLDVELTRCESPVTPEHPCGHQWVSEWAAYGGPTYCRHCRTPYTRAHAAKESTNRT